MLEIVAGAQIEIQALLNSLHHIINISQQLVLLVHKNYESISVSLQCFYNSDLFCSEPHLAAITMFVFPDSFNGRKLNSYNSW